VLPLALVSGMAFEAASGGARSSGVAQVSTPRRWAAIILLGSVALLSARRAFVLSFVRYDDDRASAIVYVQTRRDALRLVARVEAYARHDARGMDVPIEILSPDYLPLNWYLREFKQVSYFGAVIERPQAPVVIVRSDDAGRVAGTLGPGYLRETFALRPGVDLVLFLQNPEPPPAAP
ncbi:MAG TPA: hypothetical protein VEO94_02055, partial [Candidatus Dormibacteraeota bacterium]|nr:hypothetical protein [Candidatus Dormibacteraeota bacterium]